MALTWLTAKRQPDHETPVCLQSAPPQACSWAELRGQADCFAGDSVLRGEPMNERPEFLTSGPGAPVSELLCVVVQQRIPLRAILRERVSHCPFDVGFSLCGVQGRFERESSTSGG